MFGGFGPGRVPELRANRLTDCGPLMERNGMFEEFKKFALRGNVVDLAVGIVIGVAFGTIVNSLVQDIIMPVVGAITGGLDFSNYYWPLSSKVQQGIAYADAKKQGAVLGYGNFITAVLNFLIVSWVLFLLIRGMNRLQSKQDAAAEKAPEVPASVKLLTEIRDILARQSARPSS
jgi:large conductance mechanosensitive channel